MTRWRKRVGEKGIKKIISATFRGGETGEPFEV